MTPPSDRYLRIRSTLVLAASLFLVAAAPSGAAERQLEPNLDDPLEQLRISAMRELNELNYEYRNETDPARRTELALEITQAKLDLEARNAELRNELAPARPAPGLRGSPPDLLGIKPAGWDSVTLPRSTNDTNVNFAPLDQWPLPSNVATTYFNAAYTNAGGTPTVNVPQQWLELSGDLLYTLGGTNIDPGETKYAINMGPHSVKGGRHTLHLVTDWTDVEIESNELNNEYSQQYLWTPTVLTPDVPYTTSIDPPATSPGWGPWYNAEGFERWTTTQFMHAYAVMPVASSKDVDVRLNIEAPLQVPQEGFGVHEAWSSDPAGEIDFVVVDKWSTGPGIFWASVLNFEAVGVQGDKVVEWDEDTQLVGPLGTFGPFTLEPGNLIEMYDWGNIPQDSIYRIDVEVLSGNADVGLSVYDSGGSGMFAKHETLADGFSDEGGPGEDEGVVITGTVVFGRYAIAVWKSGSSDLNESVTYNIRVTKTPNLRDTHPLSWGGPIVPRNAPDVWIDVVPLPDSLIGNTTPTWFNFATKNEGVQTAQAPWFLGLYVDDVFVHSVEGGDLTTNEEAYWINQDVGNPDHYVRGGRHALRTDVDLDDDVSEFDELDNTFTASFVWTPMWLDDQAPVSRAAPPKKDPVGYDHYSCDGFRAQGDQSSTWMAVGMLPEFELDDYDIRMHDASQGSLDGFAADYAHSDEPRGISDFSLVNYDVATRVDRDYGVIKQGGASDFRIQRADGIDLPNLQAPSTEWGPFPIGAQDVVEMFEMSIPAPLLGQVLQVELLNDSGTADLGIAAFSGLVDFHAKKDFLGNADDNIGGQDETFTFSVLSPQKVGIAVYKHGSQDLGLANTFRIRIGVQGAVGAPSLGAAPLAFALGSAQPNPFRPRTSISYSVPSGGGRVRLAIYDLQGRLVRTLADGSLPAGAHKVSWNGRDRSGRSVSSGVYFVRFETPAGQETRKLTRLN